MTRLLAALTLLATLIGCGPSVAGGDSQQDRVALMALTSVGALDLPLCIDPTQPPYNAVPDDGQDDRAAIQAAIDYAATQPPGYRKVCLGYGRFHVKRHPTPGQIASLRVPLGVEIYGEGEESTALVMLGTGMHPSFQYAPGTWLLLWFTGGAIVPSVHDLRLEGGTEVVDTEEQTHLLQFGYSTDAKATRVTSYMPQRPFPVDSVPCGDAPDGVLCERAEWSAQSGIGDGQPYPCHGWVDGSGVHFGLGAKAMCRKTVNPDNSETWTLLGWWSGGDCFRFFSEQNVPVLRPLLEYVSGTDCDRATFSFQRGLVSPRILYSSGVTRADSVADSEPTGGGGYTDLYIDYTHFSRGGSGGGATTTWGGNGFLSSGEVNCRGQEVPDGSMRFIDVDRFVIRNCIINSGLITTDATVDARKRIVDLQIIDSTIRRPVGAPPNAVLNITHTSASAVPFSVTLINTWLEQGTVREVINIASLRNFTMVGGGIRYLAGQWTHPESSFVIADAIVSRVDSIKFIDVKLEAPANSVATFLRMGGNSVYTTKGRGASFVNVIAPLGMRTAFVRVNSPGHARLYRSAGTIQTGLNFCTGTCN